MGIINSTLKITMRILDNHRPDALRNPGRFPSISVTYIPSINLPKVAFNFEETIIDEYNHNTIISIERMVMLFNDPTNALEKTNAKKRKNTKSRIVAVVLLQKLAYRNSIFGFDIISIS